MEKYNREEFEEVIVDIGRVTKVVKGGRRFRFTALVVVGNRNGLVGFGYGKAASRMLLRPASEGTGVIAGGSARPIIELAGIKDILTKSLGSNNSANVVRATIKALSLLKS